MKKHLLSMAVVAIMAALFIGCSTNNISSSDLTAGVNGPNSIKGTISGTMKDTAVAFNIPFSYEISNIDNSTSNYSESWIETNSESATIYEGDTVLYLQQYFFFDRNGAYDYNDSWTPDGKYFYLEFYMDIKTMKMMPHDYSGGDPYLEGMWQQITPWGTRFVYSEEFNSNVASGTLTVDGLKYDKNSQILSGKLNMSLPNNHTQSNDWSNQNAATLTADFKIFVAKENFEIYNKGSYYGQNFRKRAH